MPTLLDYRRRIRSVKNTQQITRAMKFVAAAKLRRAQEAVFAARPYAREILRVLRSAAARVESPVHPLLARRPEHRILAVVLTGDRSLCGAFNANILRRAGEFFRERAAQQIEIVVVGKKGRDTLRKRGRKFAGEYVNISGRVEFSDAREISARIAELYSAGRADAVYAIYNEFKNVLIQRVRAEKLLPIDPAVIASQGGPSAPAGEKAREAADRVDYIYEQPIEEIFAGLVPRYLDAEIFRILLESSAAEHAARMTAMDSATRNASELIDRLTLDMNKIRQAAITKELIEIVSGAASAGA